MEFARKQLEKYGWSDGKGLGKDENGISEPVKAKIKHSLTGVGYDAASDFTEHWWSALYDKAAGNIEVKNVNGKTKKIRRKSKEEFEITNSTWKMKKIKKSKPSDSEEYSEFFVRTAVLGKGGSQDTRVRDSESDSDEEVNSAVKLTDEELFKACHGRTAHKGARHGLRALGKLARIEQQEQILLMQGRYEGYTHHEKMKNNCNKESQVVEDTNSNNDNELKTIKKRKKKQHKEKLSNFSVATNEYNVDTSEIKDNITDLITQAEGLESGEINSIKKKKKRKQHNSKNESEILSINKKDNDSVAMAVNEILENEEVAKSKKRKPKKK
ncbi:G patch domain-containing protein 4 [Bicyclus anynana]|uniref:G patch domain-containing protein 4 n=1 Tax=Bicyclus anynana TaxID=110368 RepID=A0A6J1NX83_BICAN|nr:G patch domain-containing protein 4 [Bicyclus anynana]